MPENPDSCKKLFDVIPEKLVATKHFTSKVGDKFRKVLTLIPPDWMSSSWLIFKITCDSKVLQK